MWEKNFFFLMEKLYVKTNSSFANISGERKNGDPILSCGVTIHTITYQTQYCQLIGVRQLVKFPCKYKFLYCVKA